MVWYRTDAPLANLPQPWNSILPVRPMSNLLKPFGFPAKAWARRTSKPLQGQASRGPCQLQGHIGGELIYDELGAMPNVVGSWISTRKGIRRLQYEELAKAKGINDLVESCEDKVLRSTIRDSMGVHVWAAALDALGSWMQDPDDDDDTVSTTSVPSFPKWSDDKEDDSEAEWTWEPPNLRMRSPWHQDRLASLRTAIEGCPETKQWYEEGVRAATATTTLREALNVFSCSGGNSRRNTGTTSGKDAACIFLSSQRARL
jgi:hypothetical protein